MSDVIFVNLPVESGARARAFYEGLGFSVVPQFTNDQSICIRVSDAIHLMLLEREVFAGFAPGPVADPQGAVARQPRRGRCDRRGGGGAWRLRHRQEAGVRRFHVRPDLPRS